MNESVVNIIVMILNEHLRRAPRACPGGPVHAIICLDDTRWSIQAGEYMHSTPRDNTGPWTHVEVMGEVDPTYFGLNDGDDISSYVPIEDVAQEILSRGIKKLT